MSTSNPQPSGRKAVQTRISGVMLSLPGEKRTDEEGIVMLSPALNDALREWASQPVPGLTKRNEKKMMEQLADEAAALFGMTRERVMEFAYSRVRQHATWVSRA